LRVTIIDVGQGSAALLELPGGYCVLADGGGFSNNEIFDIGARVVAPLLWHKKIRTVETLILSHPNSDHLNGLLYIAEHFHVKNLWTNGQARETIGYQHLMKVVQRKNISKPDFVDLERRIEINGVGFTIIHPDADFLDKAKLDPRYRKVNNNSIVFKATLGQTSFLFTGDITANAEKEITTATGDRIGSTVLLIPHHGSRSSSSSMFINRVHPDIGVISVGWKNRFQHPHPQILERYRQSGVKLYRTDRQGAVQFVTDGNNLRVSSYLKDAS
jgi:competence protein ComEC